MTEAGYSGTPLAQKLGLKGGQQILVLELPTNLDYLMKTADFQSIDQHWPTQMSRLFDCVLWFGTEESALKTDANLLFHAIKAGGFIWIGWPKKASRVPTTLTENVLREQLLPTGLVDVKVCAIDAVWSGLKFVIRKEIRAGVQHR